MNFLYYRIISLNNPIYHPALDTNPTLNPKTQTPRALTFTH